jgi:hypothetical protein
MPNKEMSSSEGRKEIYLWNRQAEEEAMDAFQPILSVLT